MTYKPALTPLHIAEKQIEIGIRQAVEALVDIRDNKLYKECYSTFEEYCKQRWNLTQRHVNRMIAAEKVKVTLGPIGPEMVDDTPESHLREVAKAPEEKQIDVFERGNEIAESEDRPPKASDYKTAVGELLTDEELDEYEDVEPPEEAEELPEIVQDVHNNLLGHLPQDCWPTSESVCKEIAKVAPVVQPDVIEAAHERAAIADREPKIQDYREARKELDVKHQFSVTIQHVEAAIRGIDDCNRHKKNKGLHEQCKQGIDTVYQTLQEWRK